MPIRVLESSELRVSVSDNAAEAGPPARYAGCHGVAESLHRSSGRSLFRPNWSGLSLDSLTLSGATLPGCDESVAGREPRLLPAELSQLSAEAVTLHIPPGPMLGVELTATYRLTEPATLSLTVEYRFHRPETVGRTLTAHWVSRVHQPTDVGLYLPGHTWDRPKPRWLRLSAAGHTAPRVVTDADDPSGPSRDRWHWGAPFYFGRLTDEPEPLVWLAVFAHPEATGLAYSPTAGFAEAAGGPTCCSWSFFHRVGPIALGPARPLTQHFVCRRLADRQLAVEAFARLTGRTLEVKLA